MKALVPKQDASAVAAKVIVRSVVAMIFFILFSGREINMISFVRETLPRLKLLSRSSIFIFFSEIKFGRYICQAGIPQISMLKCRGVGVYSKLVPAIIPQTAPLVSVTFSVPSGT